MFLLTSNLRGKRYFRIKDLAAGLLDYKITWSPLIFSDNPNAKIYNFKLYCFDTEVFCPQFIEAGPRLVMSNLSSSKL